MYTQNDEEKHITQYFGEFVGTVLDIGANDGKTFSNSLALIEKGWRGVLIEPSALAFEKLFALHKDNERVTLAKCAIGEANIRMELHSSGPHLKDKSDIALLSSLKAEETTRWKVGGVEFTKETVDVITYPTLIQLLVVKKFDFITIDVEGLDLEVLRQIDLTDTKLVCIEHNGQEPTKQGAIEHCAKYGLNTVVYVSGENIIIGR